MTRIIKNLPQEELEAKIFLDTSAMGRLGKYLEDCLDALLTCEDLGKSNKEYLERKLKFGKTKLEKGYEKLINYKKIEAEDTKELRSYVILETKKTLSNINKYFKKNDKVQ